MRVSHWVGEQIAASITLILTEASACRTKEAQRAAEQFAPPHRRHVADSVKLERTRLGGSQCAFALDSNRRKKTMTYIALGVNIGNLSRGKRPREPMVSRCDRINRSLAQKGVDLRVVGFYRHTGNLVLETAALHTKEAANFLSEADGATWMAVPEETMRKAVEKVRKILPPQDEERVRWTPGLAFAVTKPASGSIVSSAKVRLRSIDMDMVAAWKRDRTTERGRLDNTMREGGWGAVSKAVADQTNAQWTARSLTSLDGVLNRTKLVRG